MALLSAFACASTSCTDQDPDTKDNIGAPRWTIETASPMLTLTDGARPDLQFSRAAARLKRNGELVIGDMGAPSIRVYSANGATSRTLAQRGSGPGEINSAVAMGLVGDTLFAIGQPPMSKAGVHLYSDSGFVRSFRPSSPDAPLLQPKDRLADGAWLVEHGRGFRVLDDTQPVGTLRPDTVPMGIWHEGTADASPTLYALPKVTHTWFLSFPAVDGRGPVALTTYPFAATTVVQVSGNMVWKIDGGTGDVDVFDSRGQLVRHFVLPMRGRPFDDRLWKQRTARELSNAVSKRDSARIASVFAVGVRPALQPLVAGAIAGVDGEVWVERFAVDDTAPREFIVLSDSGAPMGVVAVPRGFDLQQIGHDYVLGIQRDADGIESILQLPLRRSAP